MAEPLKNSYGREIPESIAAMVGGVHPGFPAAAFVADALQGYEALDLMARGRRIAHALQRHLPPDYAEAIDVLLASLKVKVERESSSMASFLYLPHTLFVAEFGLAHFELSMRAQYQLTQLFTAEFSIRPFIEHHREATLAVLTTWARDPNRHVRRLVSEGTRPRLPWAPRLRDFQCDPRPVLALLELLRDDPEMYVRRSVANNLNDIGKDHPGLLAATARRWLEDAPPGRAWLVRHALRSAVKRADGGALDVMGFGAAPEVKVDDIAVLPAQARIGGACRITFSLTSTATRPQRLLVDFRVHYMKANGKRSPKVFKLTELELAPQATRTLAKSISLKEMTTRKHYPGVHRIELLINGVVSTLGEFELLPA